MGILGRRSKSKRPRVPPTGLPGSPTFSQMQAAATAPPPQGDKRRVSGQRFDSQATSIRKGSQTFQAVNESTGHRYSAPTIPSGPQYRPSARSTRFASIPAEGPSSSAIVGNRGSGVQATPQSRRSLVYEAPPVQGRSSVSRELQAFHFPQNDSMQSSSSQTSITVSPPLNRRDSLSLVRAREARERQQKVLATPHRSRLPSKSSPSVDTDTGGSGESARPSFSVHTPIPPPQMKDFPFWTVKSLVRSLDQSLRNQGKRIRDYIEVEELISGRIWEKQEQEGLKEIEEQKRKGAIQEAEEKWRERERTRHVFGGLLSIVSEYTARPCPVYGYLHQVPYVLIVAVEEVRRCGMDVRGMFQIFAQNNRLPSLIACYDHLDPPTSRVLPDLRREDIHNVSSMASTFIRSLPQPLFHRSFFDGMWSWCIGPTLAREAEHHKLFRRKMRKNDYGNLEAQIDNTSSEGEDDDFVEGFGGLPSFNSRRRKQRREEREQEKARWKAYVLAHPGEFDKYRNEKHEKKLRLERELFELETNQIAVARLILLLLPKPAFSLLMYLFTFFNELLEHSQNNRLNYDKLGAIFGFKLLGGPSKGAAKTAFCWLLTRWSRIVEGFKSEESTAVCKRLAELKGDDIAQYSVPPVGRDSRFNVDPGENLRATKEEQSPVARALPRRSRSGSLSSSRRSSLSRSSSLSMEGRSSSDGHGYGQEYRRRASEPTGPLIFREVARGRQPRSNDQEFEGGMILDFKDLGLDMPKNDDVQRGSISKEMPTYDGQPEYRERGQYPPQRYRPGSIDERDDLGGLERERNGRGHEREEFAAIEHLIHSESEFDTRPVDPRDEMLPAPQDDSSTYSEDGDGYEPKLSPVEQKGGSGGLGRGDDQIEELKRQLAIARGERDQARDTLQKMRKAFADVSQI